MPTMENSSERTIVSIGGDHGSLGHVRPLFIGDSDAGRQC